MLAIIAGQGRLPELLIGRFPQALVCRLHDGAESGDGEALRFRLEQLGSLLGDLKARGVREICLAGAVRRPEFDPARIDDATRRMLPTIAEALASGDDAALRAVMGLFEAEGFAIVAAHRLLPDLLPAAGVPTRAGPEETHRRDAERGFRVLKAMAAADIGQACVVRDGQVIAVEASPGTDWMLASLVPAEAAPRTSNDPMTWALDGAAGVVGGWADWLSGPGAAPVEPARSPASVAQGGVLVKAPKAGQDRRADLPAIGSATAAAAARAGLAGIVVEAGGVMVLDLSETLAELDRTGLFLWVREAGA